MTFALIPAAGKSVRMGRPKLALSVGDQTVLEVVIAALREAGIAQILVVIGPHVPELKLLAQAAGADVLQLPEETPDMRATVMEGLRWLDEKFHPSPDDDWLLVPADHPTIDAAVIRQILVARQSKPAYSILVPTFRGKRGHPTLIGWKHKPAIESLAEGAGLNAYLRARPADTLELPMTEESVIIDLDTPADYKRLQLFWKEKQSP